MVEMIITFQDGKDGHVALDARLNEENGNQIEKELAQIWMKLFADIAVSIGTDDED